ncbi:MAG: type IV toxin-antitoxin system AbiEi family antitoxin domain-containing protein [Alphaproteobacteria bacterium]|nr:type IV toxin-antitoxin system AbiEi family antitoxin domain-containing protein [Alphaproteobacteria bacterium]
MKNLTQEDRAFALLQRRGMVRLSEFREQNITAATLSRMIGKGLLLRLGRGLYQLADADLDAHHTLAEAAKLVPKGVICLVSALAYHDLTDTIPARIWMAIGSKDRRPSIASIPMKFVRFRGKLLQSGVEEHLIEGVPVRIFSPAKTVVDLFRYRQSEGRRYKNSPGLNLAIEGLREAIRKRKASPSQIAVFAEDAGVWKIMRPYLETVMSDA